MNKHVNSPQHLSNWSPIIILCYSVVLKPSPDYLEFNFYCKKDYSEVGKRSRQLSLQELTSQQVYSRTLLNHSWIIPGTLVAHFWNIAGMLLEHCINIVGDVCGKLLELWWFVAGTLLKPSLIVAETWPDLDQLLQEHWWNISGMSM